MRFSVRFLISTLLFILSVSTFSHATNHLEATGQAQTLDATEKRNWNKFLDIVEKKGTSTTSPYGKYLTVKSIEPDDKLGSHLADYFSLVGDRDANGKFHLNRIEVVSENWLPDTNGNWYVDQYLFRLSPDQRLLMANQVVMVRTTDGRILEYSSEAMEQPYALAHWKRIRNLWYARIGLD